MIPEHIIDKAARALYERDCKDYFDGGGTEYRHPWHEVAVFSTARPYQKRARATLEAVAAEIWEQGSRAGFSIGVAIGRDDWTDEDDDRDTLNPYRIEHA